MTRRQILTIEDSDQDHEVFCWAVKRCGRQIEVLRLQHGDQVLPFLQQQAKDLWPFLMLLDLNLPGMGGLEILKRIKQQPELQHIPVVVYTTSDHPQDIQRSYQLGASSFLKKPLDTHQLVKDVQVLLDYWMDRVVLPGQVNPWTP